MIDLSDIRIEQVKNDGREGVFKIGPLPKGYGHTFTNPLRRVLLSSLHGGAATSMRIAGVEHEYSTIKGVKETVVEIQMNIKALRFACESEEPQIVKLKKKGVGIVTAGDIEVTSSVKVMDPKAKIATITDKTTTFDLELTVERGFGYRVADEDLRTEVGRLPLHADFSPVERVMFAIEKTRKGKQMDLDQVVLSIFTDGSVDPLEALGRAAEVLKVAFERVMLLADVAETGDVKAEPSKETEKQPEGDATSWLIEDISISKRSKSRLLEAGLNTVGDVVSKTSDELLAIPGFGDAALKELKKQLEEYGLAMKA